MFVMLTSVLAEYWLKGWRVVRSVTMDAWSADQLKKMQLGGNEQLNTFFLQYGVEKLVDVTEKYNSKAAEVRV